MHSCRPAKTQNNNSYLLKRLANYMQSTTSEQASALKNARVSQRKFRYFKKCPKEIEKNWNSNTALCNF